MEVSRKQLADLLSVSKTNLNNWIARGKFPKQDNEKGFFKPTIIKWAKSRIKAMQCDIDELEKLIESLE